MGEEQRYLRYILPGLTLPISLAAAIALTSPWALVLVVKWLSGSAAASVATLAGLFLSTGGLGFLFAQFYFGLPRARPNHTQTFRDFRSPVYLEKEFGETWRIAAGRKSLNKPCGGITDKPCMKEHTGRLAPRKQEEAAWNLAHYLWQIYVASSEKQLTRDISLQAARLASLGAAIIGLSFSLALWVGWILLMSIGWECCSGHNMFSSCNWVGVILAGMVVFLVPFLLLWSNIKRLKRYHSFAVHQGLVRALQLRSR